MVVDTSAVMAVLNKEPARGAILEALAGAETRIMSTATALECVIVVEGRFGPGAAGQVDVLFPQVGIELVPVDAGQYYAAAEAWRKYGKGRHPAALNYGDCFSYALAKLSGEPILCIGNDFVRTDVTVVPL